MAIGEGRACREHAEVQACIEDNLNAIKRMKAEWPIIKERLIMSFRLECSKIHWRMIMSGNLNEDDFPIKKFVAQMYNDLNFTKQQVDDVMQEIKELRREWGKFHYSLFEIPLIMAKVALVPPTMIDQ